MGAATETDVCLLESFRAEWASLRLERQNVLLEGPCRATNEVLSVLKPETRESVVWSPTRGLDLPRGEGQSLILNNVAGLSAADQSRLLAWIGRDGSRTQVISTSERPLFEAVTRGVFDEALDDRLNVISASSRSPRTGPPWGPKRWNRVDDAVDILSHTFWSRRTLFDRRVCRLILLGSPSCLPDSALAFGAVPALPWRWPVEARPEHEHNRRRYQGECQQERSRADSDRGAPCDACDHRERHRGRPSLNQFRASHFLQHGVPCIRPPSNWPEQVGF